MSAPGPPRLAARLLARCLPGGGVRETVLGDLHEMHARLERERSGGSAAWWYWRHALAIGLGYAIRRLRRERWRPLDGAGPSHGRGGDGMGGILRDAAFALRGFARAPGFLAVALLTLAIGVGVNTAVFSVVNAVYLRPLDFAEPDVLVAVGQSGLDGSWSMSTSTAATWTDWAEGQSAFDRFAGYRFWTTMVEHDGVPTRVLSVHSLGSIFDVLGVPALLGRTFTAAEEGPGPERLVVLGHAFWRRTYGDEDPVGQTLAVGGVAHEIIGVMPETFHFPDASVDLWKTSDLGPAQLADRDDHFVMAVGRLRAGTTSQQAGDEMRALHAALRATHPDQLANTTAEVVPLRAFLLGSVGTLWPTLLGAVALVLLIACVNLANLSLSRAHARQGELALRRALGASRGRIERQLVTESLVLSLLGGAAGLGVGRLMTGALVAWMPGGVPRAEVVGIDLAVLSFTLGASVLAGLLAGLVPALRMSDGALSARLRPARQHGRRVGAGLVAAEMALAVVLVAGAGLTARGYAATSAVEPGFAVDGRTVFQVGLPESAGDAEREIFYDALERSVRELGGVRAVGVTSVFPMSGFTPGAWVGEPGIPVPQGDDNPTVRYVGVSPSFRAAAGVPLLRGRDLGEDDGREGTPALLLSESAGRLLFGGEDALGQRLYLGPEGIVAPPSTVVGIVGDVKQSGPTRPAPPMAYVPRRNIAFWRGFAVVVHADREPAALASDVRRVARALDPAAVVLEPRQAAGFVSGSVRAQRNTMLLFAAMALVALAMAVVGVSGVVAFWTGQRTREIGVRIALGAPDAGVQGLMVREGMLPVLLGVGAGVALSVWLSRFMEGLVTGVELADPVTLAAVPLALSVAAALASWIPARRASRVDPVRVLAEG